MKELTVASWNIGGGYKIASTKQFDYQEKEDVAYIISEIKKVKPDIVCLQESHVNDEDSLSRRIQAGIGFDHIFEVASHESHIDTRYKNATVILSKSNITRQNKVPIPYPEFELRFADGRYSAFHQRYLQTSEIENCMIANTHGNNINMFGYDYEQGKGKDLAGKIEEVYIDNLERPLIFVGDFNCDNAQKVFSKLVSTLKLSNAIPAGATRPDGRHTDYIFCSPELRIVESQVVKTQTDHYLCWTKFRLPK